MQNVHKAENVNRDAVAANFVSAAVEVALVELISSPFPEMGLCFGMVMADSVVRLSSEPSSTTSMPSKDSRQSFEDIVVLINLPFIFRVDLEVLKDLPRSPSLFQLDRELRKFDRAIFLVRTELSCVVDK